ncbi:MULTISPECIES: FtsX-like permease family protein [Streptomycetaceae]|uniref:Integral membrane protein n=1 Tax=Streptantibioticus cattleyicolor (strain ATCC 35852 / DSM 46488 / JCM 4925 / NBRC 14057 / NRRL 8057) TaxID=1003195 RepID=F8K2G5_STREN|nr:MULTISPECIES: FtsX-like permease family protein [Streptomycetaceae]AEW96257.1 integral membrane protein [Streptantibioticus cattleyicolor NRRL 8057 = DSM 46488]MYS60777.1 ABC transporter permease [Streptomyces sp. SID5468]CCB76597.1 putative ABC transporter permease protein [Streptantibioticus cattleyicolor NRRL 8057 = DSM 46488]
MSASTRWSRDLLLGARLAVSGGKEGWTRTALTGIGVALGVMVLLFAAAAPAMYAARFEREAAVSPPVTQGEDVKASDTTMTVIQANTTFRDTSVHGTLLRPDGSRPPLPPGVDRIPAPGEMVASPELRRMLADPGNALLRQRLPYRVVGTIGDAGLTGPRDVTYYAGYRNTGPFFGGVRRIDHFGQREQQQRQDPVLLVLVVIVLVVLLLPVGVFIATAVRFGGERRDRRLAALRLVGADAAMTRRTAAGEALSGALLGLVLGAGLFLVVREFLTGISLLDLNVFPADIMPGPGLTALVAVGVPAASVGVTLLALRGVAIEPLGLMRQATPRRRRLWWRLVLPVAGLLVLLPMAGQAAVGSSSSVNRYAVAGGAVLVLAGGTTLLPWLVEAVVRRLGGGPVPWQLATRRLQLSSGAAARTVAGITVAVAGAIAVQTLFHAVENRYVTEADHDPARGRIQASVQVRDGVQARQVITAFRTTAGVASLVGTTESAAAVVGARRTADGVPQVPVGVADCGTLRQIARIGACRDGDVFVVTDPRTDHTGEDPATALTALARPGRTLDLNTVGPGEHVTGPPRPWRIPAGTRQVTAVTTADGSREGLFATPGALSPGDLAEPRAMVMMRLDPHDPDAADRVRNTGVRLDPTDPTMVLSATRTDSTYARIEHAMRIGAVATLLVIGASLLVSLVEQLRERRRLLAVLVAFGTRRGTLALSVLWQAAVPMVLGLALAVAAGLGLGALLLRLVRVPVGYDWSVVAQLTAAGAAVVAAVTALSLPPLWRMMRPEGLRTE